MSLWCTDFSDMQDAIMSGVEGQKKKKKEFEYLGKSQKDPSWIGSKIVVLIPNNCGLSAFKKS